MSFVKLSIFGTSFEASFPHGSPENLRFPNPFPQVTTRYVDLQPVGMGACRPCLAVFCSHSRIFSRSVWSRLVRYRFLPLISHPQDRTNSSAKDQLTGVAVAVKKIMKPFSTPVLAKRTYRELKLLKHIQHENVRPSTLLESPFHTHPCRSSA